jgi:hypothetical protein
MKYYNFETKFISLKKELIIFLENCKNVLCYEISENGEYYHFEILTDAAGAALINNFLDNNTIWSRGVI